MKNSSLPSRLAGASLALTAFLGACAGSGAPSTLPSAEPAQRSPIAASGSAIAVLDPPITSFGAIRLGDAFYVAGGYHGTPHAYSREGQERAIRRLSVNGGAIESIANLPQGVQSPALVAHDGALLVIGGMSAENAASEPTRLVSSRDVFKVDPATGRVTPSATLPDGRSSHAAVELGHHVFVVGGWKLDGAPSGTFANETWVLDADDGSFVRTIAQPFTVRALGLAATRDRVVAVGGMSGGEPSSAVHVLDPSTDTWTDGPAYPGDAFGIAVTTVEGVVYASARDGVVRRLDLAAGAWVDVTRLAFPRFFHQLLPDGNGNLVAIGGILGMSPDARIALVERVPLDGSTPAPIVARVPAFGEARNRQGMAIVDDALVLFGGNDALDQHAFDESNFEDAAFVVPLGSLVPRSIAPFPRRRQSMVTVTAPDGKLLALGGFGMTEGVTTSQSEGFALDTSTLTWSPIASLPSTRTQFAAGFVGSTLVVAGGLDYDPRREGEDAFHNLSDVLAGAAPDALHAAGVELPGHRRAFASALVNGKLYVVGGMREGFAPVTDCGVIDVAAARWTEIACPSATRFSADLVSIGERLYLVGGTVAGNEDPEAARAIEAYDPATNQWSTLRATIPFEPQHVRGFAHHGRILVASTHSEDRALRLAWIPVQ